MLYISHQIFGAKKQQILSTLVVESQKLNFFILIKPEFGYISPLKNTHFLFLRLTKSLNFRIIVTIKNNIEKPPTKRLCFLYNSLVISLGRTSGTQYHPYYNNNEPT